MNIIVCFSWLGNNSLSEKQVLFLLQLHILGLIFRKVRHRTLRRAVTGALLLLFQCLLCCVFLDVLCTGGGEEENTGVVSRQVCGLVTPKAGAGPGKFRPSLPARLWSLQLRGNPTEYVFGVRAFCPLRKRGEAERVTCREETQTAPLAPNSPAPSPPRCMCPRQASAPGLGCEAGESRQMSRTVSGVNWPPVRLPGRPRSCLFGLSVWPSSSKIAGLGALGPQTFSLSPC